MPFHGTTNAVAPSEVPVSTLEPLAFRSDQPAQAGITALQQALEMAHSELRRAGVELERLDEPTFDPIPAARATERALKALFDVYDTRGAPLEAVLSVNTAIDEAANAAQNGDAREVGPFRERLTRARAAMARVMERLGVTSLPNTNMPAPLRASIDAPRSHFVARTSIVPPLDVKPQKITHAVVLPPPIAKPQSFAQLQQAVATLKERGQQGRDVGARAGVPKAKPDALPAQASPPPAPGFARDIDAAIDEIAFLRDRTRTCFEEVAMAGMQRTPLVGDSWRSSLLLERRMLASIDLIAAIGEAALEHVPRLVVDAPAKDPSRAFAAGMILGCFSGRDALAAAERAVFSKGELDAAFVRELAVAFSICPHDGLSLAMRALLHEDEPRLRALGLSVLGHRNLATKQELTAFCSDEPVVAAEAIVHLATTFGVFDDGVIDRALESADADLREAALCAMALAGDSRMVPRFFSAMDGPSVDVAALYLALMGDEQDAQGLLHRLRQTPSRGFVVALGWSGSGMAIAPLFELLESSKSEMRVAAAWALERITGAGLWEEAEVPAENLDAPEPASPEVGEAPAPKLVKVVSDPRDEPDKPAAELLERPTTDASRWRTWWQQNAGSFDMRRRYRLGQPYTPLIVHRELDTERRTPAERLLLQRELILRTGTVVRLHPQDLVQVQEQAVRDWQGPARGASSNPGMWVRPGRKLVG